MECFTLFLILIFNLSVFELVGFQTKLFKDLWYMYFHAVKVFSMFFLSSLDFCWAYCDILPGVVFLVAQKFSKSTEPQYAEHKSNELRKNMEKTFTA